MKTKDIFTLIVKTLGLIAFLYGLESILEGLECALGLADTKYITPKYWAVRGLVEVVFGLMVMRGVIPLVSLAFPEDTRPEEKAVQQP